MTPEDRQFYLLLGGIVGAGLLVIGLALWLGYPGP